MTIVAQATNHTVAFDDSQRTRCEIWIRMIGYHRPISSFNIDKQREFRERYFSVEDRAR